MAIIRESRKPHDKGNVVIFLFYPGLFVQVHDVRKKLGADAVVFLQFSNIVTCNLSGIDPSVPA